MSLPILLQTHNFLIVDKPHPYLTIPSRFEGSDQRTAVSRELESQLNSRIWTVHRLDEGVGGVLLFALNAEAHRVANGWFERREVGKIYEALTQKVECEEGVESEWKSQLVKGKRRAYERDFGKLSVTRVTFEKNIAFDTGIFGVWSLKPQTGRPHQLRYELAKHGYPIVGDALYGSQVEFSDIALRSVELDFSRCPHRGDLPEKVAGLGIVDWMRKCERSNPK